MVGFAADAECWKGTAQGNFTVKSAYVIRCGPTVPDDARMANQPKDWDLLFGSICWNLWLERNAVVFDNPLEDRGWFQANADAGCRLADGSAKCGGVIRNHDGRWVQGVAKFIGICSVLEAELWGAFTIIHVAWGLGITRIVIELDCLEAVRMIKLASLPPGSPTILFHLRELLSRPWCVEVFHIDREKNRLAHELAKLASGPSLCPIYFFYPPVPNYYSDYAITIG
ncbi:hypothetical protein GQ457_05G018590 [Hibiscus cannabinus]